MARKFDVVIIGAGPGGYTAAPKAAELGFKVVVMEVRKIGGICVNQGCIPIKALLHASDMLHVMQDCDEFDVSTDFVSFDFGKMQKYGRRTVVKYRDNTQYGFERLSVEIAYGTAVLRRDKTVKVELKEGGQGFSRGNAVIIATGTVSYMSRIPGVGLAGVWNSDRLLAAESWNFDRLTIMGGGVIAMEFATMFSNLCSHVTIVEEQKHLMAPMDDVMSAELGEELRQKSIDVYCGTTVIKILEGEGGLSCVITPNGEGGPVKMRADQILIAIGCRSNMEEPLGRDISLEIEGRKIAASGDFETSVRGICAIGDMSARARLARVAAAQGTCVAGRIAGRPHSVKLEVVPNDTYVSPPIALSCIYTDPEIATVDIAKEIAREEGLKVRRGHFSMKGNGKSIMTDGENGLIRLVFEAYSNTIVGAWMMCPRATGMTGEITTAIANGLDAEEMSFTMQAQPTYSEGIGAAIEDAMRRRQVWGDRKRRRKG